MRIFSQVFPPSTLRLKPISIRSCKSLLLLYRTSYTPNNVPLLEVTKPGMRKEAEPSSPAWRTPTPTRCSIPLADKYINGTLSRFTFISSIVAVILAKREALDFICKLIQ